LFGSLFIAAHVRLVWEYALIIFAFSKKKKKKKKILKKNENKTNKNNGIFFKKKKRYGILGKN
jgi:hypothetical protein